MLYIKHAKPIWIPLLCVFVATIATFLISPAAAWYVSNVGTVAALVGVFVYIVFFDSKKRNPNLPAHRRFAKLITYDKDWK